SGGPNALLTSTSLYFLSLPGTVMILLASRWGGGPGGFAGYAQGMFSKARATVGVKTSNAAQNSFLMAATSQTSLSRAPRAPMSKHINVVMAGQAGCGSFTASAASDGAHGNSAGPTA